MTNNNDNTTTWEHSEDGSEGIELESINDVAGVDQL